MNEEDWIFFPREHRLANGSRDVQLPPKTSAVLEYLLDNENKYVTREAILEKVWPGLNVTPDLVREHVCHLRAALGDDARSPHYLETRRGQGFRLLGGIARRVPTATESAARQEEEDPSANRRACAAARDEADPVRIEHRTITVLCCGITGPPLGGADEAALESDLETRRDMFERARGIVERHGGSVLESTEHGFLGLFGAPRSHEDNARRAALASLELVQEMGDMAVAAAQSGDRRGVSIGLDTGRVAVGVADRGRGLDAILASGPALDSARRLKAVAGPHRILTSPATFRELAGEFRCERHEADDPENPSHVLRGVIKLRGGTPNRELDRNMRLVGRGEELAVLRESFARARAGNPRVVALTGAAGIGKSRLLATFLASTIDASAKVLALNCLPHASNTAYRLLKQLALGLCEIPTDDVSAAADKARAALDRCGMEEWQSRAVMTLIGAMSDPDPTLSPRARRTRLFDAVETFLLRAAAIQPIVVVIEDLHWIDRSSAEWLAHLVGTLGDAKMLVLASFRPEYDPGWKGRAAVTQLALSCLTVDESETLIRAVAGDGAIAPSIVSNIMAKASGNPFFLIELSHAAVRAGRDSDDVVLPDTIQAAVLARADQLGDLERDVLQICAVMGEEISTDLLSEVSGIEGPALDACLTLLQERQLLRRSHAAAGLRYRFSHAIIEDGVYSSLSRKRKAWLHLQIARKLEADYADIVRDAPEMLARHYERSDPVRAIRYWYLASRNAYGRSANVEAIEFARRGLDLVEAQGIGGEQPGTELDLVLALAPALVAVRGYGSDELKPHYDRAIRLCERDGDPGKLFRTLIGRWNFHWVRGELDLAHEQATRLLRRAKLERGPGPTLRAHAAMGEILFHMGELDLSSRHLDMALMAHRDATGVSRSIEIGLISCLCYAAWTAWHLGRADTALEHASASERLAESLQHPLSAALSAALVAELHQFRGDAIRCHEAAERAMTISSAQQFPFWQGTAMVMSGWAQCRMGASDAGTKLLREGIEVFSGTGARIQIPTWLGMLAEVCHEADRADEAMECVNKGLSVAEDTREFHYLSELHRIRGDILSEKAGHAGLDEAEAAYRRAIDIARKQSARVRQERARDGLARLLRGAGRMDDAERVVAAGGRAYSSRDVRGIVSG